MRHIPVLLPEVIDALQLKPGMNVVDGTLGDGGHAEAILKRTAPTGKLLGIDADPESILRAKKFLHTYENRTLFVRDNFVGLADIVAKEGLGLVHGVILDLGWSTPQFEERRRGFSFLKPDEPLDMRYDKRRQCAHQVRGEFYEPCTAASIVNNTPEGELAKIFKEYGEEALAKDIAAAIIRKREEYEIETVQDLVNIVLGVYRRKLKSKKDIPWIGGLHPATKVFQALRIAVNDELEALEEALPQAIKVLSPGGRLAVITFHSLEDRMVKHTFKKADQKTIRIITKKPIVPEPAEVGTNPRAGSAKLRVAEKM